MHRRNLLLGSALLPFASAMARVVPAYADETTAFDGSTVRNIARQMAQQPYQAPDQTLPDPLKNLDYQAYRSIRFDQGHALWKGQGLRFTAEFFHRGYIYKDPIVVYEVANGNATRIRYDPSLFTFDKVTPPTGDIGFAGFRLHYPLNRPDYNDEVCAFLGASYFRAVAKHQGYGISARGLAIKTADPAGEEFPQFRSFWLERPAKGADALVMHALLDSPSATAAFRFTIRPGQETVFDTEAVLYPRVDIAASGIAPLTSMFMFDNNDRARVDDYREAVHDFERSVAVDRQGRARMAAVGKSPELADQRVRRWRHARVRIDAARAEVLGLPGPRGALREPPFALGRADRRLG